MKKILGIAVLSISLITFVVFSNYWVNTQPVGLMTGTQVDLQSLPQKNRQIIQFVESNGRRIAPDYDEVVCTEFVIAVLNRFTHLTAVQKRNIRVITEDDLKTQVENDSPATKGEHTALAGNGSGMMITSSHDVRPGDFVQFWNIYQGKVYGHCGIVIDIQPNESIGLYSSHPMTNGFGKQKFLWPDKIYFVRLR